MTASAALWLLAACQMEQAHLELELDGPARIEVERLGPVRGPHIVVEGAVDAQPTVTIDPAGVAELRGTEIYAIAPGEATVRAVWREQEVSWILVVKPALPLAWQDPPDHVDVGGAVQLRLRSGDHEFRGLDKLVWRSSDAEVASVSSTGEVLGRSPGLVYVSAQDGTSRALLELRVMEPAPSGGDEL